MEQTAFGFNRDAKYAAGGVYEPKNLAPMLSELSIRVTTDTATGFKAKFPDMLSKYKQPSVNSEQLVQAWNTNHFQFWQNQVNFTVWCATTGCGVSAKDHIAAPVGMSVPLAHSVFIFHVYYQIRRILQELQAPLPQDQAWNAFDNPYDRKAYERICREFSVSSNTDWRQKQTGNNGLGLVYVYATNVGYIPYYLDDPKHFNPDRMSFTAYNKPGVSHVDYVAQGSESEKAWTTFIIEQSKGLTQPGVERLNDSIRTYVWALLGAQAHTRSSIVGIGTAFDAQKQLQTMGATTFASSVVLFIRWSFSIFVALFTISASVHPPSRCISRSFGAIKLSLMLFENTHCASSSGVSFRRFA